MQFFITGSRHENLFANVGDELIWESAEEMLLGVTIDKNLNFNSHLSKLCKKVGQNVTALFELPIACRLIKSVYYLTNLLSRNSLNVQ